MKKIKLILPLILFAFPLFAQEFTSSNLPIVVITTSEEEEEIPDDPKITVQMGIIYNGPGELNYLTDPFNHYEGPVGIETRGNSTQDFDKKTYSLELRHPDGSDSSATLLGMPKEEDWILHAMVLDKTQLRIPMSFYLSQRMGHYASRWRYCELVINDEYRGLYILTERIKRDKDRVDIAKLKADDIEGDQLSGGYILRIDWLEEDVEGFETNKNSLGGIPFFLQYYYPRAENIQPEQTAYIRNYINEFQDALWAPSHTNDLGKHYSQYIDMTSFADFLIMNEISKNSDGYKLSSYIHKDKTSNGGLIKAGPIWDFDQSYGKSLVCSCHDYENWTYMQGDGCEDFESMPLWWSKLMDDPVFTNHLKCRWETLREGPLHLDSIYNWMDEQRLYIQDAVDRNFTLWDDFLGEAIWAEPEPIPEDYEGEFTYMKWWIQNRMDWLDANMPGDCSADVVGLDEIVTSVQVRVYPNPSQGSVFIDGNFETAQYRIYDLSGQIVQEGEVFAEHTPIDIHHFASGSYLLEITGTNLYTVEHLILNR